MYYSRRPWITQRVLKEFVVGNIDDCWRKIKLQGTYVKRFLHT